MSFSIFLDKTKTARRICHCYISAVFIHSCPFCQKKKSVSMSQLATKKAVSFSLLLFRPFYLPISSGKGGKAILLMTFPFRASSSCESPKWAVRSISSVAKLKTRNHRAHYSFSHILNFHFVSFHKRFWEKILVKYNIINKDGRSILANEQSQANFLSQAVVELLKRNKILI